MIKVVSSDIISNDYFVNIVKSKSKVLSNIFESIIGEKASENIKSAAGDVSKDITKG